jgi:hypothetical protein
MLVPQIACAPVSTDTLSSANQLSDGQLCGTLDEDSPDIVLDALTSLPGVVACGGFAAAHTVTNLRLDPVREVRAQEHWRVRSFDLDRVHPIVFLEYCKAHRKQRGSHSSAKARGRSTGTRREKRQGPHGARLSVQSFQTPPDPHRR